MCTAPAAVKRARGSTNRKQISMNLPSPRTGFQRDCVPLAESRGSASGRVRGSAPKERRRLARGESKKKSSGLFFERGRLAREGVPFIRVKDNGRRNAAPTHKNFTIKGNAPQYWEYCGAF